MRLLFVHGARVVKSEAGRLYTDGSFTQELWNRYLLLSKDFHVLLRDSKEVVPNKQAQKLSEINEELIGVSVVPDDIKPRSHALNPVVQKEINRIVSYEVQKADAIIIRMPSGVGERAVYYAKKYKKNYLIEAVGDVYTAYKYYGGIQGKILAPIKREINRKIIREAPFVLYVSNTFLQDRYPTRGISIGCPDVTLNKPNIDVLRKRINKIHESTEEIILGLIGVLGVNYRGHATAIRTVKVLLNRGINVRIKFLGSGSPSQWLELSRNLGIEDKVEFCGSLPGGNLVMEWIDDIDILIMPTKQETLGRAIIEAMSRGCPVVGSRETAIGEQLGSDCLALSDDYEGFADIIERMVGDLNYMEYCAYENFYRSFKYCNEELDKRRSSFYKRFINKSII